MTTSSASRTNTTDNEFILNLFVFSVISVISVISVASGVRFSLNLRKSVRPGGSPLGG